MNISQARTELLRAMTATMWLCGQLRGSEIRVLHALTIDGLSMGKLRAKISYTRIAKIAGVARPVASKAMTRLVELGFVMDDEGAWRLDVDLMQERASVIREELFPRAA